MLITNTTSAFQVTNSSWRPLSRWVDRPPVPACVALVTSDRQLLARPNMSHNGVRYKQYRLM